VRARREATWHSPGAEQSTTPDADLQIGALVRDLVPVRPRTRGMSAYRVAKRALDVAGSAVPLVLLAPRFLVVGLAIRLDSPGPVFYVQRRVGEGGRIFPMIKFRTMRHGSGVRLTGAHKQRDDDRITRVGRVLRMTSIDELPQLINVLLGQ